MDAESHKFTRICLPDVCRLGTIRDSVVFGLINGLIKPVEFELSLCFFPIVIGKILYAS